MTCTGFSSKRAAASSTWVCPTCQVNSTSPLLSAIAASPIAHTATRAPNQSTPFLADETPPWPESPVRAELFTGDVVDESQPTASVSTVDPPAALDHSYFQVPAPNVVIPDVAIQHPPTTAATPNLSCESINSSSIATVRHVPKKCRNNFSRSLCASLENLLNNPSLDAYTELHGIAKCILAPPA